MWIGRVERREGEFAVVLVIIPDFVIVFRLESWSEEFILLIICLEF